MSTSQQELMPNQESQSLFGGGLSAVN